MKLIYCANCGHKLPLHRKALPGYGRIIDLVEPHECTDEPLDFDLEPIDVPVAPIGEANKFVQILDELPKFPSQGDLRQKEFVKDIDKTSAPGSLLGIMGGMGNTTPAHDIGEEPDNGEAD